MLNLYLSDLYKMRKSAAMKVLVLVSLACAGAVFVMSYLIAHGKLSRNLLGINFLLSDWSMVSILGGVAASILICGDFDNRSVHEAIANGGSRWAVVLSKAASYITALFLIIIPYILMAAVGILSGLKFNMGSATMGFAHLLVAESGRSFTAAQAGGLIADMLILTVILIGQLSFCLPLAILTKKPVIVIVLNYMLSLLAGQLQAIKGSSKLFDKVFACTPFGGDYGLTALNSTQQNIFKALAVSVIFTAVMVLITCVAFRKSEIK